MLLKPINTVSLAKLMTTETELVNNYMVPSDSVFVNGDSSLQLTKALVIRSHPLAPLFIDKVS